MSSIVANNRPILFVALSALLAILFSTLSILVNFVFGFTIVFLVFIIGIVFLLVFISLKRYKLLFIVSLMIIVFAVICSIFLYSVNKYNSDNIVGNHRFYGTINSIEGISYDENDNKFIEVIVNGEVSGNKVKARAKIPYNYDLVVGNKIEFTADFYKAGVWFDNNFIINPLSERIYYSTNNLSEIYLDSEVFGLFNKIKYKVLNSFKAQFSNDYGIAYAMFTGDDSYVSKDLLTSFRLTGISHIFAVSGLHIGFIYTLLLFIYKFLKLKGKNILITTFIILFLYVWFCGFSSSCIRAFVIIYTLSISKALNEKADRLTNLSFAFIITLIINPFDFYSAGFQLSFAVYSAIVFLSKPIYKLLSTFCFDKVAKYLASFLSAYLASLPLAIDFFNYSSIFSPLFNILLVPILGFCYILIFITAVACLITSYYGIFAIVPNVLLNLTVTFLSNIDARIFLIDDIYFGFSKLPYYFIGLVNTNYLNISKKHRIILSLVLLILFILTFIIVNMFVTS